MVLIVGNGNDGSGVRSWEWIGCFCREIIEKEYGLEGG